MKNKYLESKYWNVFKLSFKKFHEYKFNLYGRIGRLIIYMLLTTMVWYVLFEITGTVELAGLDKYTFIIYSLIGRAIFLSVSPWYAVDAVQERVLTGELTGLITKPVNLLKYFFMNGIFYYLIIASITITITITINFVTANYITIYTPNLATLILFLISTILALCIHFMFYLTYSTLTFWFGELWSTISGLHLVENLLSGAMIPLTIIPGLAVASNFLPYKFMNFIPVFIYLNQYNTTELLFAIGGQIIWLIILIIICHFMMKKGLKKFESFGG